MQRLRWAGLKHSEVNVADKGDKEEVLMSGSPVETSDQAGPCVLHWEFLFYAKTWGTPGDLKAQESLEVRFQKLPLATS